MQIFAANPITLSEVADYPYSANPVDMAEKNLWFFGETFEYFTGTALFHMYENKLVEGDFLQKKYGIHPDFFVVNEKNGELEEIIEVKSGRNLSGSKIGEQGERFLELGVPLWYITFDDRKLSGKLTSSSLVKRDKLVDTGMTPLFSDTSIYELMTNKPKYEEFMHSFEGKHKVARKALRNNVRKVFRDINEKSNEGYIPNLNYIKDRFNDAIYKTEKTYS